MLPRYDIALLHASPIDGLMKLDIVSEVECLKSSLQKCRKRIEFISNFATAGDVSEIVSNSISLI